MRVRLDDGEGDGDDLSPGSGDEHSESFDAEDAHGAESVEGPRASEDQDTTDQRRDDEQRIRIKKDAYGRGLRDQLDQLDANTAPVPTPAFHCFSSVTDLQGAASEGSVSCDEQESDSEVGAIHEPETSNDHQHHHHHHDHHDHHTVIDLHPGLYPQHDYVGGSAPTARHDSPNSHTAMGEQAVSVISYFGQNHAVSNHRLLRNLHIFIPTPEFLAQLRPHGSGMAMYQMSPTIRSHYTRWRTGLNTALAEYNCHLGTVSAPQLHAMFDAAEAILAPGRAFVRTLVPVDVHTTAFIALKEYHACDAP